MCGNVFISGRFGVLQMSEIRGRRRDQVSVRLDERTVEVIERVAEQEMRSVSGVVRLVLSDWASGRRPRVEADAA